MPLRLAVIEDEPLALNLITRWLAECADVVLVGSARTVCEAEELIANNRLEGVFLDINLRGENGFRIAEQGHRERAFDVVFVSAHADYALPAFRVDATDFLSKPFTRSQLHSAVERLRRRREQRESEPRPQPTRIRIRDGDQTRLILGSSIQWIESAGGYSVLHSETERHLVSDTLTELQEQLGAPFVRIHRSVLVNVQCIAAVQSLTHGDARLHLHSGSTLRMSRRYRQALSQLGYL